MSDVVSKVSGMLQGMGNEFDTILEKQSEEYRVAHEGIVAEEFLRILGDPIARAAIEVVYDDLIERSGDLFPEAHKRGDVLEVLRDLKVEVLGDQPPISGDPVSLTKYDGEEYICTAQHLGEDAILLEYRYTPPPGRKTTNLLEFNCTLEYREAAALAFMLFGHEGRLQIAHMRFNVEPLEGHPIWPNAVGEYGDTGVTIFGPKGYVRMIVHRELAANVLYGMIGL